MTSSRLSIFAIFLLLLAVKTIFIVWVPLELSPDEAYYWDWSRHLDWGYYSKPPMVAWLIAISTNLLGNTELGVRFPAALLSVIGLWFLCQLALEIYGKQAAILTLLMGTLAPGAIAMSFIMTIDAPLICFWSVGLYCLWRALNSNHYKWWLVTGLVVGLGLLSKQTMVAFVGCAFLFMVFTQYRKLFLTLRPYSAALIALLMIVPTLLWNYHHQWITFQHTAHHFEGLKHPYSLNILGMLALVSAQIAIMSPGVGTLALLTAGRMAMAWRNLRLEEHYLFFFGPLPFFLTMLLALKQDVNANWPAPFCLTFFLLLAGTGHGPDDRWRGLQAWLKPALTLSATLAIAIYIAPFILSTSSYSGAKWDITARLKGWRMLSQEVEKRLIAFQEEQPLLISNKRQIVSCLAFYLPGQPQVLCWPEPARIKSQYDLWLSLKDQKDRNALVILEQDTHIPSTLMQAFEELIELPGIQVSIGRQTRCYRVLYGRKAFIN